MTKIVERECPRCGLIFNDEHDDFSDMRATKEDIQKWKQEVTFLSHTIISLEARLEQALREAEKYKSWWEESCK